METALIKYVAMIIKLFINCVSDLRLWLPLAADHESSTNLNILEPAAVPSMVGEHSKMWHSPTYCRWRYAAFAVV